MNEYKIRSPYSLKEGDSYVKIEVQQMRYNKDKKRSDRLGKMYSLRIDLDSASTWKAEDVYNEIKRKVID